jgi:aspartate racemase
LCYRTICVEGTAILGPHAHPEVTVHTFSLADYMACIYRDDWASVADARLSQQAEGRWREFPDLP